MKTFHRQNLKKRVIVYCMSFKRNKYLGLLCLTFLLLSGSLNAQTQINGYTFNGSGLTSIAKAPDGGTYVGGDFTNVAQYSGCAIRLNPGAVPELAINNLKFEGGVVNAIVPIPGGGWYVGGTFKYINGMPKSGLVRVNADGSLHSFSHNFDLIQVQSMVMDTSGRLYAAGFFSSTNTIICFNLDGTIYRTYPNFDSGIFTIALDANENLLVGGIFSSPKNRLAKFNADGSLNAFSPVFNVAAQIYSVKFTSSGGFLVGGTFTTVNGITRNRFAKFNADNSLNAFSPNFNSSILAIAIDQSDNFYVGGQFTTVDSNSYSYIAGFLANGTLTGFNPGMDGAVTTLSLDSTGALYAGGLFNVLFGMGANRKCFAKFNPDGSLSDFKPSLNDQVKAVAVDASGSVYLGGYFLGINPVTRNRFAKFNADGTLASANINFNGVVSALTVDGLGNLYVGGSFTTANGSTRNRLAKFDANLTLTSFVQNMSNQVYALASDSFNNLYAGGAFTSVSSSTRWGFVKFDSSGTLTAFNPMTNPGAVRSIVIDNQDNVYIGGIFFQVLGQTRQSFAKINANGTLSGLNPVFNQQSSDQIYSLAVDNSGTIYAGGNFTSVNGISRTNLAKINPDGSLNDFNPILNGTVYKLLPGPTGNLFVGGTFSIINGASRSGFAKFNPTGTLNSFIQKIGGIVQAIVLDGSTLHLGGGFQRYQVYANGDSSCDLTLTNPIPASRCGAGTVQLSITPSSGSVNWYDAPENGNLVGTGSTFTTPNISTTTTFYAEAVDGACFSFTRTAVTATVTSGCESIINLKLFVQGYYTGNNTMASVAFNQGSSANTDEVETVTVELWNPVTQTLATSTQATLKTDGTAICTYSTAPNGSYYLAVKGSNFIKTWSVSPVTIGPTPLSYDFTDSADKAYLANMAPLGNNVFGFHSGDINQDNSIDTADYSLWEMDGNNYAFGVYPTDLNGDGIVDFADYSFWEYNNNNYIMGYGPW